MSSEIVAIDIGAVRERVAAAAAEVRSAEQAELEAQRILESRRAMTAQARSALEVARGVETMILQFAVVAAAAPAPSLDEVEPALGQQDGTSEFDLSSLSTKVAVVTTLAHHAGRTFGLDELVAEMTAHGFGGTHNAVHVQLSRIKKEHPDWPIERVRQGHYRYRPGGTLEQPGSPPLLPTANLRPSSDAPFAQSQVVRDAFDATNESEEARSAPTCDVPSHAPPDTSNIEQSYRRLRRTPKGWRDMSAPQGVDGSEDEESSMS